MGVPQVILVNRWIMSDALELQKPCMVHRFKCRSGSDLLTHCDYAWIATTPRACVGRSNHSGASSRPARSSLLTYTRHFEPVEQMAHWFAELQMAQAPAERILSLINDAHH